MTNIEAVRIEQSGVSRICPELKDPNMTPLGRHEMGNHYNVLRRGLCLSLTAVYGFVDVAKVECALYLNDEGKCSNEGDFNPMRGEGLAVSICRCLIVLAEGICLNSWRALGNRWARLRPGATGSP